MNPDDINNQGGDQEPSKLSINGQEYDPADVAAKLERLKGVEDAEARYGITYDKVWSEYGRRGETLKSMETELTKARTELETYQRKQDAGVETAADTRSAQEAARKLGLTLNEDLEKQGYIKKDDLEKYISERESKAQALKALDDQGAKLEAQIDGSDGRPRFNYKAVKAYVREYGQQANFKSLEEAYEDMYQTEIKGWKEKQLAGQQRPGLKTLNSAPGNKQPQKVTITDDNVKDLLSEALGHK